MMEDVGAALGLVAGEFDIDIVLVALIGLLGIIIPIWMNRKANETQRKVDDLHAEVRTNHGKRAGEYIESIPEILEALQTADGRITTLENSNTAFMQEFVKARLAQEMNQSMFENFMLEARRQWREFTRRMDEHDASDKRAHDFLGVPDSVRIGAADDEDSPTG